MPWKSTIEQSSRAALCERVSKLSLEKAFQSPQVSGAKAIYGEVWLAALIVKAINEVCGVLNAAISADSKTLMAEMLINDKWYLRVDEILLVLARGTKGYYGLSNKNLNQEIIYSWFEKHERERDNIIEADHEIKKNSAGNNADRNSSDRNVADGLKETIEKRIDAYKNRKPWNDKTDPDEYGIMNDVLK